jgi:parallel beta-helix repeat protein
MSFRPQFPQSTLNGLTAVIGKPVVTVSAVGFDQTGFDNNRCDFGPDTPGAGDDGYTVTNGVMEAATAATIVDLTPGTYTFTAPVVPPQPVKFLGKGATVAWDSSSFSAFEVGQPNVEIYDLGFNGLQPTPSYANVGYYGVSVTANTTNLKVKRCTFQDIYNIGIAVGRDVQPAYLQSGEFTANQFYGGNSAISGAMRYCHLERNYMSQVGVFAFELDGSIAGGSFGNTVTKNTFLTTGYGAPGGLYPHAVLVYESMDNLIEGNLIEGTLGSAGISLDQSAFYNRILGNDVNTGATDGIYLRQCDYAIVSGNHCYNNGQSGPGFAGIHVASGGGLNIPIQCELIGNELFDDQGLPTHPSGSTTQSYGVTIDSASAGLQIISNKFYHNLTAPINNYAYAAYVVWNQGFNPQGWGITTPSLPAGTGSANAAPNNNPFPVRIYSNGGVDMHIIDTTPVDHDIGSSPGEVTLDTGCSIYWATAVPGTWSWYGV